MSISSKKPSQNTKATPNQKLSQAQIYFLGTSKVKKKTLNKNYSHQMKQSNTKLDRFSG